MLTLECRRRRCINNPRNYLAMRHSPRSHSPFPALGDLSPDEIAAAIEQNDAAFLLALGRAGGGEERDDPRLRWVIGGSPVDHHNCVVHADLPPEDVDAAVAAGVGRIPGRGAP